MAGMCASVYVAQQGASVCIVEKGPEIGGSAVLSGGYLWTAVSFDLLREFNPEGDPELGRILVDEFEPTVEWAKTIGAWFSDHMSGNLGYGHGYLFDVLDFVQRCRAHRAQRVGHGGDVLQAGRDPARRRACSSAHVSWTATVPRASGPAARSSPPGGSRAMPSSAVGTSASLRPISCCARTPTAWATRSVRLSRSAPGPHRTWRASTGISCRGRTAASIRPTTCDSRSSTRYHCLLVDRSGRRFVDESYGYHWCAQALVGQPENRGLILLDERVYRELVIPPIATGAEAIDRFAEAERDGVHVAVADTWEELAAKVTPWGYDGAQLLATVHQYNAGIASGAVDPTRSRYRYAFDVPPLRAVEVEPAITFAEGGIAIDTEGRVLDPAGEPIPGLYAAGADAAGVFVRGYAGGLANAAVFGLRAAWHAVGELVDTR